MDSGGLLSLAVVTIFSAILPGLLTILNKFPKVSFSLSHLSIKVLPPDLYFCFPRRLFFPRYVPSHAYLVPLCPVHLHLHPSSCTLMYFSFKLFSLISVPLPSPFLHLRPNENLGNKQKKVQSMNIALCFFTLPLWDFRGRSRAELRICLGAAVALEHLQPHQPLVMWHLARAGQNLSMPLLPDNLQYSRMSPMTCFTWGKLSPREDMGRG